jgi:pilus assembly protein CpaE
MTDPLKTILILSEEHTRIEYRRIWGKVDCARIALELLSLEDSLSAEAVDGIAKVDPQILFIDLPKDQEKGLSLLRQTHQEFPQVPILALGDSYDAAFLLEAMRSGVKEVLPRRLHAEQLKQACQRIYKLRFHHKVARRRAKIFSFLGSKGGSGTTSIAANFAASLAILSKKRLLLVDLDLHLGTLADFFGIKNNKYLFDGKPDVSISDPEVISDAIMSHPETGVDLLTLTHGYHRRMRPIAAEITYLLNFLQREYDYIVVDASSSIDENTVAALDASHLIFLISKCDLSSLRNTQRVLHMFQRWGYPDSSHVRLLINRYSKEESISLKRIEKVLNFNVFWAIANDFRSLTQSIELGKLLIEKKQSIPLVKTFYELSAQILGIQLDLPNEPPRDEFLVRARDSATQSLAVMASNLSKVRQS